VAYPNLNVKFVLSHHGLDTGMDGVTHQLTEDIAIFRSIPNLILLQPADMVEMRQMVDFAIEHQGPVIIKSGKSSVIDVHEADYKWQLGCPSILAEGKDVAIVSNGVMLEKALNAHRMLQEKCISARVVNLSTLAGYDVPAILKALKDVKLVVSQEDHSIYGGIGGIVSEILSEHRPTRVLRVGLGDSFAECGPPTDLYCKYDMDEHTVVRKVEEALSAFPNLLSH